MELLKSNGDLSKSFPNKKAPILVSDFVGIKKLSD